MSLPLSGKVAIVTGGSRGIGRECCLALARLGCHIVVAAKSRKPKPNLPGSIYTVAKEVRDLNTGADAIAYQLDVRDDKSVALCADHVFQRFGRIDILVNNASALWWQDIKDTPMKKYDLINSINSRGTFAMTKACLPYMQKHNFGRVITMSPPINLNHMAGHTAYNISKFGMTLVALGVAQEYADQGITANSLWPATVVESQASINFKLGDTKTWRKATILADCVTSIVQEDDSFTGQMLIDDKYLKSKGVTAEEMKKYRCDPDTEPLRLLDLDDAMPLQSWVKRGDVKKLHKDMTLDSKL